MGRRFLRKGVALLIAVMCLVTVCGAAEPAEKKQTDRSDSFAEKIQELNDEYGFISTGTTTVSLKLEKQDFVWPEDIADHSEGILFADVHDYDGDGEDELLVFRRQKGFVNIDRGERVSAQERRDYLFEMYEYNENRGAYRASGFLTGVFDLYNVFVFSTSTSVFRRDTEGKTEIFMETFKRGQDHPQNISLIHLVYDGHDFVDYSGFRYGCLFFGDGSVQFQKFKSLAAFDFLSYPVGKDDPSVETLAVADMDEYESVKSALRSGLAEYGLTLRRGEEDPSAQEDSSDASALSATSAAAGTAETGSGETTEEEPKEDIDDLMDRSALGGYASSEGRLEALGYLGLQLAGNESMDGNDLVRLERFAYTADPEGVNRVSLGSE